MLLLLNSDSRGILLLVGVPGYHVVGSVSVRHYLLVRHRITLVVEVGDTMVFFLSRERTSRVHGSVTIFRNKLK